MPSCAMPCLTSVCSAGERKKGGQGGNWRRKIRRKENLSCTLYTVSDFMQAAACQELAGGLMRTLE